MINTFLLADLFNTLSALFDDFCVYKVKDLYFDDCTSMLFANAAQNAMPTLPQYFEPLGKWKISLIFTVTTLKHKLLFLQT